MPESTTHRWHRKKAALRAALEGVLPIAFDIIFGERDQPPPTRPGRTVVMTIGPPRKQKGK